MFNLWRSGAIVGLQEPDLVKIYAPKLGRKVSIPPPLPEDELVRVDGPIEEWCPQPECNVPEINGFDFYELSNCSVDWKRLTAIERDLRGVDTDSVRKGLPIDQWDPRISFVLEGTKPTDFLEPLYCWPVASDRFKQIMEEEEVTGVTFHEVTVTHKDGTTVPRYWYMNVLGIPGALDWTQHPEYRCYLWRPEKFVERTAEYTIRQDVVGDRDLFRAVEKRVLGGLTRLIRPKQPKPPTRVFASARFRDLCMRHECTGIEFMPRMAS